MISVSIVVPVRNEAENIGQLHSEIKAVCHREGYTYEIIIVDDGSTDRTAEIIRALKPVTLIILRRTFGQTAAMEAGIKRASYEFLVTMDGDLQNDPQDIPRLLKHLMAQDIDAVSGWRKKRQDPFSKRVLSQGAYFLRRVFLDDDIHDSGCTLRVYRRKCFENIIMYGEMHRFIPSLLKIKGFSVEELPVNHRPRTGGESSYDWKRTVKGFLDLCSIWFWGRYSLRPLHLMGGLGLLFLFGGLGFGVRTVQLFLSGEKLSGAMEPLLTVFFVVIGFLLLILGLLSDIIVKIYYENTRDTPYSIREALVNPSEDARSDPFIG